MASIKPYRDHWRAHVCVRGVRDSATFRTRREADAWAAARETELRAGAVQSDRHTVSDALLKYAKEVSVKKRGARWEQIRLEALDRMASFPSGMLMSEINTSHLAEWRDVRLRAVKPGTVLREISLLSAVFEAARREWRWIQANPFSDLRRPGRTPHRDVLLAPAQIRAMLVAMGWRRGPCRSTKQAAGRAFMLALRSGMRAGEICNLTWANVRDDYCILPVTKTVPRNVPLTPGARRTIATMAEWDDKKVFGLSAQTLDAVFRKARSAAGLDGFVFHDARHYAATKMAQRVDVLTLCKIFGWKQTSQALTYYNPSASDIATLLLPRRSSRSGSGRTG